MIVGEGPGDRHRSPRVLTDPQKTQVHAGNPVPHLEKRVPQPQGVLPARDAHADAVIGSEHVMGLDGPFDLFVNVVDEALRAERRVVPADLHGGRTAASPALHLLPPETTGRTSISSASS